MLHCRVISLNCWMWPRRTTLLLKERERFVMLCYVKAEAFVNHKVTHTFVYICVLLGDHFVASRSVSEELHCLVENIVFININAFYFVKPME